MREDRTYKAIILNEPFAGFVKQGIKTLETRMRNLSELRGDVIFCCDGTKSKHSVNAGRTLCLVTVGESRPMKDEDEKDACIGNAPGRIAYPLSNLRHFSYNFMFSPYKVFGDFRGVFKIKIPPFVTIIEQSLTNQDKSEK